MPAPLVLLARLALRVPPLVMHRGIPEAAEAAEALAVLASSARSYGAKV